MDSMLELGWAPPAAEEDEVDMKAILEQADQERRQSLELVAVPRKASRRSTVLRGTDRSSNNPAGLPQVYEADRSQGWPGGEAGRRSARLALNPHQSRVLSRPQLSRTRPRPLTPPPPHSRVTPPHITLCFVSPPDNAAAQH